MISRGLEQRQSDLDCTLPCNQVVAYRVPTPLQLFAELARAGATDGILRAEGATKLEGIAARAIITREQRLAVETPLAA